MLGLLWVIDTRIVRRAIPAVPGVLRRSVLGRIRLRIGAEIARKGGVNYR
jgi:hypothetical protein